MKVSYLGFYFINMIKCQNKLLNQNEKKNLIKLTSTTRLG